ncbi:pilus assembly protein [Chenggangzhangella methanolivorans]|uniref:Putative Flp pilus-assembly TadG-like N-terminal domain-containing protein n=1 Tax=Chenggangzhangella methanolivorans TaxID=1437009 RepID=A0A9E6R7X4_9HYPH|nr:pilus assembly protein TadG-related protein [Chenggangzhangella methanolivorans]QZN99668.1 hypothetical protein K6K41_23745 [Chenggangzhangella methanolivorans]
MPLIGLAGGAIDYSKAIADRARLNNALDAAVIVGAKQAQSDDAKNLTNKAIRANAKAAATDYFNTAPNLPVGAKPTFTVKLNNRTVTVEGSYTSTTPASLLKIIGFDKFAIGGTAASAIDLSPMVDIHLLIDVSGSMALGATTADINKLTSNLGCAFACHDGVKVKNTQLDAFEWALANGVTLRINEINAGILDFIAWLKTQTSSTKRIRIAVHSFSTTLETIVPITATLNAAATNLPKAPDASGEFDGATHFNEIMAQFSDEVGASGDGAQDARKLVIIATDGVQDPNRTWSWNIPLRKKVVPFSPDDCRKIDPSVSIGVLYAPYLKMPWDWGYNATLGSPSLIGGPGTRWDDIVPQLKACTTSADLFVDLSTTASVGAAFTSIFQRFTQVRLTK